MPAGRLFVAMVVALAGVAPARGQTVGDAPTGLRVVHRVANTVTFAWLAPSGGVTPTSYLLEGAASGRAEVLASVPTGGPATQITLTVPDGTFDVWVVAVAGGRRLGQSAPVRIYVNTLSFPASPHTLLASAVGDTVTLSWTNSWSAATLTGVQLLVGGSAIATLTLPVTESFAVAGVPRGIYYLAQTALNGGAPGGTSGTIQLNVPGTCLGPPNPPTAFSFSAQGGRVYLDWRSPANGEAVTSYVLDVSGAFTGTVPTTSRSLAVPVWAGSYTVRVASVGPCGTSAFTAPQTVVVP